MKIARRWWQFLQAPPKPEEPDPDVFERVLKTERELNSLRLELADLEDFTHRMAKRRYTQNYDADQPVTPRKPPGAPGALDAPRGVAGMTPQQKREFLRHLRKA